MGKGMKIRARLFNSIHCRAIAAGAIALTLATSLAACSGKAVNDSDPNQLYADALEDLKADHYQTAIEKLRTVKNKFPYSKVAVDAQLKIADVYFAQESWAEAASAYETFRDLHPRHERVAYAMYRAAKSFFNDIPSPIARDLTPATKAVDAYNEFLKQFPAAPEVADAQKDLGQAREDLAMKELYIGDFYFKREFYDSAKGRYQKIIELYPASQSAGQAKSKLDLAEKYLSEAKKEGKNGQSNDPTSSPGSSPALNVP